MQGMARLMLSCEKATQLSSKKLDQGLSFSENLSLKVHQATCKICKQYEQEIEAIDHYARSRPADFNNHPPFKLSDSRKKSIKKELIRELGN